MRGQPGMAAGWKPLPENNEIRSSVGAAAAIVTVGATGKLEAVEATRKSVCWSHR